MLTTCRYFDIVGNRCSRVTCGKCDDLPDCEFKYIEELKAENERLKEQMIRLSEENGNLIIRANTSYNNYRDTQRRLDELCKANIHNLALLSKANKTLQKIKEIAEEWMNNDWSCFHCRSNMDEKLQDILDLITKAEEE